MRLGIENEKYMKLVYELAQLDEGVVALSGGVDSSLLAYAAKEALGEKARAVTIIAPHIQKGEWLEAKQTAEGIGISHTLINLPLSGQIVDNPKNRCYHCKKTIFQSLKDRFPPPKFTILEGSNFDDLKQYRPGKEALTDLGIRSPLLDCALTKAEIRSLAQAKGLKTANKPSNVCLLTRFPYDTHLDSELLEKVEAAENVLKDLGFASCRVRVHSDLLRIEINQERFNAFWQSEIRENVVHKLKALGFNFITLDLQGLRSGCFDSII